jgi:methionyl-tRNA formyltransferase
MPIVSAHDTRFVYFGTPEFAAIVLAELEEKGYRPSLVVTAPDKPKGRKLVMTPSEVHVFAKERGIPVLTPATLRDDAIVARLKEERAQLFVVAAYGKIVPKEVLDIPEFGTLNVHPSLLPKFRGASPIESAILSDEKWTGVTIMVLDEELDHGPILAQRERITPDWPPKGSELTRDLAHFGGRLLAEVMPEYLNGLAPFAQDHSRATFTKKITKEDGLIDLLGDPVLNYKKIRAFDEWPGAYFFVRRGERDVRVKVTDARLEHGKLVIVNVIPEGKREMPYEDFLRGAQ